jgi:hypothetical protein
MNLVKKIITNIDLPKNTSTINKLVSLKETKRNINRNSVEEKTKNKN